MKQHPVWNALSHATAIGSGMFIVFFFIDRVNPAMDFLGSALSKWCLFLTCVASLMTALCSAIYLFKKERAAGKRPHAAHRQPEDGPLRRELPPSPHRPYEPGQPGRHGATAGDPRQAHVAHDRKAMHDTRYDDER